MTNLAFLACLCIVTFPVFGNGQVKVSKDEFAKGVTSNGFPKPSSANYNGFISAIKAGQVSNKMEAAMFLAQVLHESGGFKYVREIGCSGSNGCPDKYPESGEWRDECKSSQRPKSVSFYGRGYMQLTWCSNYAQASRALGKGDSLKNDPDSVAKSPDLAWGVSGWYWSVNVHSALGGTDEFGRTTKAINGQSQECQGNGQNADKSKTRFKYYVNVFKAFGLKGTPNEAGCRY